MHPTLKSGIAVVAGVIVGSVINGGIVGISGSIIPLPAGVDNETMEGLKAGMQLFEPRHFLFPFLAHALGTLSGASLASLISDHRKMMVAMIIGGLFFIGGLIMVLSLPSPLWFSVSDLILAYFPMAFVGARIGALRKAQ
jgi:hypothetical protein